MLLSIPREELKSRQAKFINQIREKNCDGAIIFGVPDIFYLTAFHFIPTERPIALFVDPKGKVHLFVPSLEHEHAEEYGVIDFVHSYTEYPGIKHPMEYLKEWLIEYGLSGKNVGYDTLGYGSSMGYQGPTIDQLFDAKEFISLKGVIGELRVIKSPNEIALIRESCIWSIRAHELLQQYTKAGLNEIEISNRASMQATMEMIETLGPEYKPNGQTAKAYFRGQIGPNSAFPHSVTQNTVLEKGDTLVTAAISYVFGYTNELERTMFVEEVTKEQEMYFHYMHEAQQVAFEAIKPGVTCSSVEVAVQDYFKDMGVFELTRHHTGHAMGIVEHEAPFFDLGDHTEIKSGMVFAVEPAIYVKGTGGFRHSDTVLVTDNGIEILTKYPSDIESLICS